MGQVTLSLNGRTYRLRCGEGQEPRLVEMAEVVRAKLDGLVAEFGQAGDDRLLLMAALLLADELTDLKGQGAGRSTPTPQAADERVAPPPMDARPTPRRAFAASDSPAAESLVTDSMAKSVQSAAPAVATVGASEGRFSGAVTPALARQIARRNG